MGEEKDKSALVFQIERQTEDNNEDTWISRNMEVYSRNSQDRNKIDHRNGSIQSFDTVGQSVAIVQKYEEGMHDKLNVDAIVVVDAPNLVMDKPFVFERTSTNTIGMTLIGDSAHDNEIMAPGRSMESVMLRSGGDYIGPLQAGFTPKQEAFTPIGKVLDKRQVRLKITDMRPKPPAGIPPLEPVPMV